MKFTSLEEPYWDDKPVFIVGGGTSLIDFDFDKIKGEGRIIGVNDVAFIQDCDVIFSLDKTWARNRVKEVSEYKGERYLAMPPNFEFDRLGVEGVTYLEHRRGPGMSERPDYIYGSNSGFGALNLAFLKKAKEIFLLGFDMKTNGKRTHWHQGYKWHSRHNENYYRKWADAFNEPAKMLREAGTKVFNCNPDSGVTCFPICIL